MPSVDRTGHRAGRRHRWCRPPGARTATWRTDRPARCRPRRCRASRPGVQPKAGLGAGVPLDDDPAAVDLDEGVRAPGEEPVEAPVVVDPVRGPVGRPLAARVTDRPSSRPLGAGAATATVRVRRPWVCAPTGFCCRTPRTGRVSGQSRHGRTPHTRISTAGAVVPAPHAVDRPPRTAVYRACRGRGHRNRAEAGMGGQGPATGGAGPARAVVDPGAHPRQSAPLRARLRPRARRRRRRHRRRRLGHRRGVGVADLGTGDGRRQHRRTSRPCS